MLESWQVEAVSDANANVTGTGAPRANLGHPRRHQRDRRRADV